MPLYLVAPCSASLPASAQATAHVPCRCCPGQISRSVRGRAYPSDMSDAEWAVIEPLLPAPGWTLGRGGSPGSYCRRDIVNAIRYLTHNGCVWRAMPADLPHWRTVYHYVRTWQKTGATRRTHDTLREQVRVLARRGPQPTAAIIDSQSVKAADTVGKASRGCDAGKKIEGRKRHLAVDTLDVRSAAGTLDQVRCPPEGPARPGRGLACARAPGGQALLAHDLGDASLGAARAARAILGVLRPGAGRARGRRLEPRPVPATGIDPPARPAGLLSRLGLFAGHWGYLALRVSKVPG